MFDDVRAIPPAVYLDVPVERVVDRITSYGTVEPEFCFAGQLAALAAYVPRLSGSSARVAYSSPQDPVLGAACWAYLRDRSRELPTEAALADWALRHRWPGPERFGGPADAPAPPALDRDAVLNAITEGGKYDPRTAFLYNVTVALWDPDRRAFHFPDIPDHPTAEACREYLRHSAFVLDGRPGREPGTGPDPFMLLIDHATDRGWPAAHELAARVEHWIASRP